MINLPLVGAQGAAVAGFDKLWACNTCGGVMHDGVVMDAKPVVWPHQLFVFDDLTQTASTTVYNMATYTAILGGVVGAQAVNNVTMLGRTGVWRIQSSTSAGSGATVRTALTSKLFGGMVFEANGLFFFSGTFTHWFGLSDTADGVSPTNAILVINRGDGNWYMRVIIGGVAEPEVLLYSTGAQLNARGTIAIHEDGTKADVLLVNNTGVLLAAKTIYALPSVGEPVYGVIGATKSAINASALIDIDSIGIGHAAGYARRNGIIF